MDSPCMLGISVTPTYRLKGRNGSIREGLSASDLQALAQAGVIQPDDLIAKTGLENWTAAKAIRGLALAVDSHASRAGSTAKVPPPPPHHAPRTTWREIVQDVRRHVPLIESSGGQGSGLLVSCDGVIVTNRHVIEGARFFDVTFYDGAKRKAVVVHRHESLDLALIRCALQTSSFFDLSTRIATGFDAGDEVIAIGHPCGLTFTSTSGIISAPSRMLPEGEFVQTDVATNPGNSGGPLLDISGKLVGLHTQGIRDSQGLGFAIPGFVVAEYCEQVKTLLRAGQMRLPTDQELAALENMLTPEALVEAALRSINVPFECRGRTSTGSMEWTVHTPSGQNFSAYATKRGFFLLFCIDDLPSVQRDRSKLLWLLLRWQEDMDFVRFGVDDDDYLSIRVSRYGDELGIADVRAALLEMCEVIDDRYETIQTYLK